MLPFLPYINNIALFLSKDTTGKKYKLLQLHVGVVKLFITENSAVTKSTNLQAINRQTYNKQLPKILHSFEDF